MVSNLPKIAIVGRPNVGKSTLFNRLVGRKQAIVDDIPGVTRDRQYGQTDWEGRYFTVVDTGGFVEGKDAASLEKQVKDQAWLAVLEADLVLFVVDARTGLTPADQAMAQLLRRETKPVFLTVNKVDSPQQESLLGEFHRLGFKDTLPVSGETSRGISDLLDRALLRLGPKAGGEFSASDLKLAIVGRPNVGKSTLLNALLGEDRAVVHERAGTTRDPLNILVERGSRVLEFVDTAGIRRKAQSEGKLEKISVLKAFKAVDKAHMALVVIDAVEGVTSQDAKVLSYAEEKGKGILLVLNKWDKAPPNATLKNFKERFRENFKRLHYAPMIAVSAKLRRNIKNLFKAIDQLHDNYMRRVGTGELNRVFQKAVAAHPHPVQSGQYVQLHYLTQTGWGPPTFVLFCNRPKMVKEIYLRYLERVLRDRFGFEGAPIRWVLRGKK
jgi:ribosome-associated GTPase EngA